MPKYDYKCPVCNAVKEVSHPVSEIGKIRVLCDACQQPMKKLLSLPTLIGFDSAGRSIGRKDRDNEPAKEKSAESPAKKDTPPANTSD